MKQAARISTIMGIALLAGGCTNLFRDVDSLSFESIGGTLFSNPSKVTMKEIHLDNGTLLGREIVLEGAVVNIGEFTTHLTISDETARMLIVLTDLTDAAKRLSEEKPQLLRVLGTVERGKKGLPYILARAISPAQAHNAY